MPRIEDRAATARLRARATELDREPPCRCAAFADYITTRAAAFDLDAQHLTKAMERAEPGKQRALTEAARNKARAVAAELRAALTDLDLNPGDAA
jgi:hypothetical protein